MRIRIATNLDRDNTCEVYLRAFPEGERELVAKLAIDLLSEETTPRTISLVAENGGIIVGHVAFSPVKLVNNESLQGYILAPLGVKPEHQKRGIGSKLVEHGKRYLSKIGVNILFTYGDPEYYGRFGFSADAAGQYNPPYGLQYPFGWQAVILRAFDIEETPVNLSCVASLRNPELW